MSLVGRAVNSFRKAINPPKVYPLYEPEFTSLTKSSYEKCNPGATPSETKRRRRYLVYLNLKSRLPIDGAIAECGVFKGTTSHLLCSVLKKNKPNVRYEVYDSFEGLSEPNEVDRTGENMYEGKGSMSCSLSQVKKNLDEFDFIHYYKGFIPQSFPINNERNYSFVHIDLDLYEPIKASLEYFYPKMAVGGTIIVDDFNTKWQGCVSAVRDFCSSNNIFYIDSTIGSAIIQKL